MLRIESFALGALQTNAYLLTNEQTKRAVLIDPGTAAPHLLRRLDGLQIEAILLTHAHFDHIGGVTEVRKRAACPVYLHPLEADWLTDARKNGSLRWPDVTPPIELAAADYDLADGMTLKLLDTELRVMHTPGHSPGSVSFLWEQHVFSGDALFRRSIGRTDLPGGNTRDLLDSIRLRLFRLPDETTVYPGHGAKTTIGYEKQHNPYVD